MFSIFSVLLLFLRNRGVIWFSASNLHRMLQRSSKPELQRTQIQWTSMSWLFQSSEVNWWIRSLAEDGTRSPFSCAGHLPRIEKVCIGEKQWKILLPKARSCARCTDFRSYDMRCLVDMLSCLVHGDRNCCSRFHFFPACVEWRLGLFFTPGRHFLVQVALALCKLIQWN